MHHPPIFVPPVFVYDGHCVLCSKAVQFTLKNEKPSNVQEPICFISMTSAEGQSLLSHFGIDPKVPNSFLFIENGMAHKRSDAVIALARHLRFFSVAAPLLRLVPRKFRDWLYQIIADNRYRIFGKSETCMTHVENSSDRFQLSEIHLNHLLQS